MHCIPDHWTVGNCLSSQRLSSGMVWQCSLLLQIIGRVAVVFVKPAVDVGDGLTVFFVTSDRWAGSSCVCQTSGWCRGWSDGSGPGPTDDGTSRTRPRPRSGTSCSAPARWDCGWASPRTATGTGPWPAAAGCTSPGGCPGTAGTQPAPGQTWSRPCWWRCRVRRASVNTQHGHMDWYVCQQTWAHGLVRPVNTTWKHGLVSLPKTAHPVNMQHRNMDWHLCQQTKWAHGLVRVSTHNMGTWISASVNTQHGLGYTVNTQHGHIDWYVCQHATWARHIDWYVCQQTTWTQGLVRLSTHNICT